MTTAVPSLTASRRAVGGGLAGYGLLYLPVVAAFFLAPFPALSYWTAWLGSWWILWASMSGRVKPLPGGVPIAHQLMRPVGFTQAVFAGYTALTSVFFALDLMGVSPAGGSTLDWQFQLWQAAEAQRYYLLGHAGVTTGILAAMDYRRSGEWRIATALPVDRLVLWIAGGAFVASFAVRAVPGLGQLVERFQTVSIVASVLVLALALAARRPGTVLVGLALFLVNATQALLSGWKEEVLVLFLLLAALAYPVYRRTVLLATPLLLVLFLAVVPTYNQTFRELNWVGQLGAEEAARQAVERVRESTSASIVDNGWTFLTDRASEASLFTHYLDMTPRELPYAGGALAGRALAMVAPRLVWPGKPNVEQVVMERAYANGAADPASPVSAKPQFVVDGYLSGGALGVWLACLAFGLVASWASRLCERWFGGYLVGSALLYTALFKVLWRGNSFEFIVNAVVWAFALLVALFLAGRYAGWIERAPARRRPLGARR